MPTQPVLRLAFASSRPTPLLAGFLLALFLGCPHAAAQNCGPTTGCGAVNSGDCFTPAFDDGRRIRITSVAPQVNVLAEDGIVVSWEATCVACLVDNPCSPITVQAFVDGDSAVWPFGGNNCGNGTSGSCQLLFLPDAPCEHTVQLMATYGECIADSCAYAWSTKARYYVRDGDNTQAETYATCEGPPPGKCVPSGVGDPVDVGAGKAFTSYRDIEVPGPFPVAFTRNYDSSRVAASENGPLGQGWFSPFFVKLVGASGASSSRRLNYIDEYGRSLIITRGRIPADGLGPAFEFRDDVDGITAKDNGSTWTLTFDDRSSLTFEEASGRLQERKDAAGNVQTLGYLPTPDNRLSTVRDGFQRGIDFVWVGATSKLDRIRTQPGLREVDFTVNQTGGATVDTLNSVTLPTEMGSTTTYSLAYTAAGRLLSVRDAANRTLESHAYDASNRAATTAGPGGRPQYSLTYDTPAGGLRTVHVTDAFGRETLYTIRVNDGIALNVDGSACGCADRIDWTYDSALRVSAIQKPFPEAVAPDPAVLRTEFLHDARGRLTRITDDAGGSLARTTEFKYLSSTFIRYPTEISVPSVLTNCGSTFRKTIALTYADTRFPLPTRRVVTGCRPQGGTLSQTTDFAYDPQGRWTSITGPEPGVTIESAYWPYAGGPPDNQAGHLMERRTPGRGGGALDKLVTRFQSYNVHGQPTLVIDINGAQTSLEWGFRQLRFSHVLPTTSEPQQLDFEYRYDDGGLLTRYVLPSGHGTTYASNDQGLPWTATDDEGGVEERTYDELNRLVTRKTYLASTPGTIVGKWDYAYDNTAGDQWLRKAFDAGEDPLSPTAKYVEYQYDSQGSIKAVIEPGGQRRSTAVYDRLGRPTEVAQRAGAMPSGADLVSRFAWDVHDNLVSITDPRGLPLTSRTFNDLDQVLTIFSPDSGTTTLTYTTGGRLQSLTDAQGRIQQVGYDPEGRIKSVTYPAEPARNVTFTYDEPTATFGRGRLTSATEAWILDAAQPGRVTLDYDRRGFVTAEKHWLDPPPPGFVPFSMQSSVYDVDGNALEYGLFRFTYDFASRPITVEYKGLLSGMPTWRPLVTDVDYKPMGPATLVTFANGRLEDRLYDAHLRPTQWKVRGPTTLLDYAYTWTEGRLTSRTDNLGGGRSITYTYDAYNRLDHADGGAALWGTGDFDADKNGNTELIRLGAESTSLFYVSGTNRLDYTTGTHERAASYDGAGNLLTEGGPTGHTFDYTQGDLVGTVRTSAQAEWTAYHAPLGGILAFRRPTILQQHSYLYGANGLLDFDMGHFVPFTRYAYLNDSPIAQGTTQLDPFTVPISWLDKGFAVHADPFGTVHAMTNEAGSLVWQADYTPYGDIWQTVVSTEPQRLGFLGQVRNEEIGVVVNGLRLFDAAIGRYTQPDPMGVNPGRTLSSGLLLPNLYGFADANPVMNGDPLGLYTKACHAAITRAAGEGLDMPCLDRIACVTFWTDLHPWWGVVGLGNIAHLLAHGDSLHFQPRGRVEDRLGRTVAGGCGVKQFGRRLHYLQDAAGPHLGIRHHLGDRPGPDICPGLIEAPWRHEYTNRDQDAVDYTREWLKAYQRDCGCECRSARPVELGARCQRPLKFEDYFGPVKVGR
jgi:RHS repeat-associated protein